MENINNSSVKKLEWTITNLKDLGESFTLTGDQSEDEKNWINLIKNNLIFEEWDSIKNSEALMVYDEIYDDHLKIDY
ncbi:hypothetical protein [Chryseobacterium sp. JUb7]|uniref:hypothetical protein n=1 Tax=Chryseobacterium sp. JUb7 TaxID=2940599 RepID=UPI00216A39D5|nr:hypothetical protein [Chryseobacterium sp. JUb7]MCS3529229.1 hypothetical protein [Chryseobacterium sp. JUb7]